MHALKAALARGAQPMEGVMSKRLVVCYSLTGSTSRVALHLADALGADLDRIDDALPRRGVGGYVQSALEALAKGLPTILTTRDPRYYDLVVLGTPVWVGTMASPVRSYIAMHGKVLRRAGFFAVMSGRGGQSVVHEMQAACGAGGTPTCVLTQREVDLDKYHLKCADFVRTLTARDVAPVSRIAAA
jgi:hypothetical protein